MSSSFNSFISKDSDVPKALLSNVTLELIWDFKWSLNISLILIASAILLMAYSEFKEVQGQNQWIFFAFIKYMMFISYL